eukprot:776872-Pleurochrysis_carterae.AAC.1
MVGTTAARRHVPSRDTAVRGPPTSPTAARGRRGGVVPLLRATSALPSFRQRHLRWGRMHGNLRSARGPDECRSRNYRIWPLKWPAEDHVPGLWQGICGRHQ